MDTKVKQINNLINAVKDLFFFNSSVVLFHYPIIIFHIFVTKARKYLPTQNFLRYLIY